MAKKLYVGNLAYATPEDTLFAMFGEVDFPLVTPTTMRIWTTTTNSAICRQNRFHRTSEAAPGQLPYHSRSYTETGDLM